MLEHILNSIDFYFLKLKNQFEELKSYTYFTDNYNRLILYIENYFQKKYNEFLETGKDIRKSANNEAKKDITYYNEQDYESNAKFFLDYFKVITYFVYRIKNARNMSRRGLYVLVIHTHWCTSEYCFTKSKRRQQNNIFN